jgi:hypothetical protein
MKNLVNAAALAVLFVVALPLQAATDIPLPALSVHQQKAAMPSVQALPTASLPTYTILPSGTNAAVTFAHGIDNNTLKATFNSPALLNISNPTEILPPSIRSVLLDVR